MLLVEEINVLLSDVQVYTKLEWKKTELFEQI